MSKPIATKKEKAQLEGIRERFLLICRQLMVREDILNQTGLAEHFDIDVRTVNNWFTGRAMPTLLHINRISEISGKSCHWIIAGKRTPDESAAEIKKSIQDQIRILQETLKKL